MENVMMELTILLSVYLTRGIVRKSTNIPTALWMKLVGLEMDIVMVELTIYNTIKSGGYGGDCAVPNYPDCHVDVPELIGHGVCSDYYQPYNTAECGFDGGDRLD